MAGRIFNLVALVFFILTLLVCAGVAYLMLATPPLEKGPGMPTLASIPTETQTSTPKPTLPPTFTPTPTETTTPSITPTLTTTPSITPSVTLSPTITATATITPTPTNTLTFTPAPTVPTETSTPQTQSATLSPFLFDLKDGQVIFTVNFANTAGCAWQGVAGQVFDIGGQPMVGMRVHVFSVDVDRTVDTGSNSLYGISGWEIPLSNIINTNTYYVELQSAGGTVVSPRISVTFPSDCARNLALINFAQTRPR